MAEKPKPPALRVVGDSEHYYEKRYKYQNLGLFVSLLVKSDNI
jgi:hypothetical protein